MRVKSNLHVSIFFTRKTAIFSFFFKIWKKLNLKIPLSLITRSNNCRTSFIRSQIQKVGSRKRNKTIGRENR